jgi:hypothetical protein
MIPLLQVSADPDVVERAGNDLDLALEVGAPRETNLAALRDLLTRTASARYTPELLARGITEFQLTRGLLGISV